MTSHQTNVLTYLRDRGPQFIDWVASQPGEKVLVIEDMAPLALRFLDVKLREEMALYDPKSKRYCTLIDMLIEIHLTVEGEFRHDMNGAATKFLVGQPKYEPN